MVFFPALPECRVKCEARSFPNGGFGTSAPGTKWRSKTKLLSVVLPACCFEEE